jgi:hypothetical protein
MGTTPAASTTNKKGHLSVTFCIGGGSGGNRTRVQEYSTGSSTYLVLSFDLIQPTRTHTLRQDESPRFNREPSNPAQSDSLYMTPQLFPVHPKKKSGAELAGF